MLRRRKKLGLTGTLLAVFSVSLIQPAVAAPQKHLPYVAMHDPTFIPAAAASFLDDEDRVIGVVAGKSAKAFPAAILAQHGLVEDQAPDGPIAITW